MNMTTEAMTALMTKQALTVEKGSLPNRVVSNTVGRLGSLLSLHPIMSLRSQVNPETDERIDDHIEAADLIEKAQPKVLDDTKLRLGGGDIIDDLILKAQEEGEDSPLYKRLGGRVWHNKRTGILQKLLGTVVTPASMAYTDLTRSPHYNPITDVATNYWDEPAVTEHELGHAIDFNQKYGDKPKSYLGHQAKALKPLLYQLAYGVPGIKLHHEAQANIKSDDALFKALKNKKKKYKQMQQERWKVLPAGYGSYVGEAIAPGGGGILGAIAGKIYGSGVAKELATRK